MKLTKLIITVVTTFTLSACGGGGGAEKPYDLSAANSVGDWSGKYFQDGGVVCQDIFIGACSGCELGDVHVKVTGIKGLYDLKVDRCSYNGGCFTCHYFSTDIPQTEIIGESVDIACPKQARFNILSPNEADMFEEGRPPTKNTCFVNLSSTLTR